MKKYAVTKVLKHMGRYMTRQAVLKDKAEIAYLIAARLHNSNRSQTMISLFSRILKNPGNIIRITTFNDYNSKPDKKQWQGLEDVPAI